MKDDEKSSLVNPLLERDVRPDRNWHELMEQWQAASTLGEMLSVLHRGFDVPLERWRHDEEEYSEVDRLIFYFTIADGWTDFYLLRLPEDDGKEYLVGYDQNWNVIKKTPGKLRQELAHKAFDMLCLNYFRTSSLDVDDVDEFVEEWERMITIIKNFFRAEETKFGNVRVHNLSDQSKQSHNEQLAINFLLNLARFIFAWKDPKFFLDPGKEIEKCIVAMHACIDAAKPWMVEVLTQLKRLDLLREWILELDEVCLSKLKEIALRRKFSRFEDPVLRDRPAVTLDEACYLGSEAAWFLKEHELKTREHKRLEAILDAEQKKDEAERELEKLNKK